MGAKDIRTILCLSYEGTQHLAEACLLSLAILGDLLETARLRVRHYIYGI